MKLESGWYWVKWYKDNLNWECAVLNLLPFKWIKMGVDSELNLKQPAIIGPRIEPPEDHND